MNKEKQLLNSIKNGGFGNLMSILINTTDHGISNCASSLDQSGQNLDLLTEYSKKLSSQKNEQVSILYKLLDKPSDFNIKNLKTHCFNNIVLDGKNFTNLNIKFPLERQNCIPIDGVPESEILLRELKRNAIDIYFFNAIMVYYYRYHKKLYGSEIDNLITVYENEMRKYNSFNYIKEIEKIIECVKNGELYTLNYQITNF